MKLYIAALLALSGCIIEDPCEEIPSADNVMLKLQLLSASGEPFFFRRNGYVRDSARIVDEQGLRIDIPIPQASLTNDAPISCYLLERGKEPVLHTLITRQYMVYFKKADQDTLRVQYQLSKSDCNTLDVDVLQVFYNNNLVYNNPLETSAEILVTKP
ncbi:hypothetical protein [Hymenobacter lucidus]|uniref:DUF4249 family protein n=1 Tax=Hymenobacter lucidus TaxID=2880930 RepID=A0ABS8AQF7_9BACT|nr:hypothetical protein [Hymenobacter lucidus]MCB2408450.1 hypothetical protein [Hymenobacter lucidus]